ncbi:hypothetical protein [Tropicimonas marinistellae]|uniref:hypothetical protein n=1 Tax=Tropicimonas marinistellae TaxID=1739787 RepID=UPI00082DEE99|nr:hypothetical protein [Tropicimonas marinistellae]
MQDIPTTSRTGGPQFADDAPTEAGPEPFDVLIAAGEIRSLGAKVVSLGIRPDRLVERQLASPARIRRDPDIIAFPRMRGESTWRPQ